MYDKIDPRAALAAAPAANAPKPVTEYFGAQAGLFYEMEPQEKTAKSKTWITRGASMVICYSDVEAGAEFSRDNQPDEYVLLLPEKETTVEVTTEMDGTKKVDGYTCSFLPPGKSKIKVLTKGRIVTMFTPKSKDIADKSSNASAYTKPHPTVPQFQPWPDPPGGFKLRTYSLDVKVEPGRFGRIFRCTTFMVNYLDPRNGPRERTKVSPHHHDDFEQCSLAISGEFMHHLRWPWVVNKNNWLPDDHELCGTPSIAIIPPPSIHTTEACGKDRNQLVDIFCPPRMDFSQKPGWILNADDYPMPGQN
jgi:hypothetical protein